MANRAACRTWPTPVHVSVVTRDTGNRCFRNCDCQNTKTRNIGHFVCVCGESGPVDWELRGNQPR